MLTIIMTCILFVWSTVNCWLCSCYTSSF